MSTPQLEALSRQVAEETLEQWWRHAARGTEACVPHLARALQLLLEDRAHGPALVEVLAQRLGARFGVAPGLAARAVAEIGASAAGHPRLFPLLMERTGDRNLGWRRAAVDALGRVRPGTEEAFQAANRLLELLEHEDLPTVAVAARSLFQLAATAPALRERLRQAAAHSSRLTYAVELMNRETHTVDAGAENAAEVGPVTRLLQALDDRDPAVRARAARRLAEVSRHGIRIFGERWQVRVVTQEQLRFTAARQAARSARVPARAPGGARR